MNAEKAKKEGFIDEIIEPGSKKPAKAAFDLSVFNNVPDDLLINEPTVRDMERALRDVGCSQNQAKAIVAGGYKAVAKQNSAELEAALLNLQSKLRGGKNA